MSEEIDRLKEQRIENLRRALKTIEADLSADSYTRDVATWALEGDEKLCGEISNLEDKYADEMEKDWLKK